MSYPEIIKALTALEARFGNLQSFAGFRNCHAYAIFPLRTFQFTEVDLVSAETLAASVDAQINLAAARLNQTPAIPV